MNSCPRDAAKNSMFCGEPSFSSPTTCPRYAPVAPHATYARLRRTHMRKTVKWTMGKVKFVRFCKHGMDELFK